jgi:tellurite resistance protein
MTVLYGNLSGSFVVPASFFGSVLGLVGLGNTWRAAHRVWMLPAIWGELLMLLAGGVWTVLIVGYAAKWIFHRDQALAEIEHPIQCCFVGLLGVSTSLIAVGAAPYFPTVAHVLFVAGTLYTLIFGLWQTGLLWGGARDRSSITPVMYLPLVAGAFVTAIAASALGYAGWGQLAFGAGLFSWLAIESVVLHRLYTAEPLPLALRPLLGVQLAPPAVGAVAYLNVLGGPPDLAAHALMGYALLQGLLLIRMLPWIMKQPFAPSYWAFTFGATALATAPLLMIELGEKGAVASLAPYLFVAANLSVGLIAVGTLRLIGRHVAASLQGRSHSSHAA